MSCVGKICTPDDSCDVCQDLSPDDWREIADGWRDLREKKAAKSPPPPPPSSSASAKSRFRSASMRRQQLDAKLQDAIVTVSSFFDTFSLFYMSRPSASATREPTVKGLSGPVSQASAGSHSSDSVSVGPGSQQQLSDLSGVARCTTTGQHTLVVQSQISDPSGTVRCSTPELGDVPSPDGADLRSPGSRDRGCSLVRRSQVSGLPGAVHFSQAGTQVTGSSSGLRTMLLPLSCPVFHLGSREPTMGPRVHRLPGSGSREPTAQGLVGSRVPALEAAPPSWGYGIVRSDRLPQPGHGCRLPQAEAIHILPASASRAYSPSSASASRGLSWLPASASRDRST